MMAFQLYDDGRIERVDWTAPAMEHFDGHVLRRWDAHMFVFRDERDERDGPEYKALVYTEWHEDRKWSNLLYMHRRTLLVAEIHVVRADGMTASWGTLVSTAGAITAVGGAETGDLVAGSAARFCGVVVGSRAYRNTRGGEAQTIMVAGAWDLPARRVR